MNAANLITGLALVVIAIIGIDLARTVRRRPAAQRVRARASQPPRHR